MEWYHFCINPTMARKNFRKKEKLWPMSQCKRGAISIMCRKDCKQCQTLRTFKSLLFNCWFPFDFTQSIKVNQSLMRYDIDSNWIIFVRLSCQGCFCWFWLSFNWFIEICAVSMLYFIMELYPYSLVMGYAWFLLIYNELEVSVQLLWSLFIYLNENTVCPIENATSFV